MLLVSILVSSARISDNDDNNNDDDDNTNNNDNTTTTNNNNNDNNKLELTILRICKVVFQLVYDCSDFPLFEPWTVQYNQ